MRNILCNVRQPIPILVTKVLRRNLDYAKNLQVKYFTGKNIPIYSKSKAVILYILLFPLARREHLCNVTCIEWLTKRGSGFFLPPLRGRAEGEGRGYTESVDALMMSNWSAGVSLGFSLLEREREKWTTKHMYMYILWTCTLYSGKLSREKTFINFAV